MTSNSSEDLAIEEIARALDRGEELDGEELRGRLGELGGSADELVRAAERYRELFGPSRTVSSKVPSIRTGECFGDFEVVDFIGRGAVGEVYLARQTSLGGRRVALKILREGSRGPHGRRGFEREAMVLADLHHPNLAEIYGIGEERGHPFLAMQLVEGPTLRAVIAEAEEEGSRVSLRRRVRWIAEVADALAAVHRLGLVHRDVKPANILIEGVKESDESHAVLVDFGLVRSGEDMEVGRDSLRSATFAYASPEQLLGLEVGSASDVFSLGVTMHDLIVTFGPEQRDLASLGLQAPEDLDPDLAAILERACDPEQAWRYPDAGAMAEDLRHWLAGESVSARRPSLLERLSRTARENAHHLLRWGVIASLSLFLITLASAVVRWNWDRDEARLAELALADGEVGLFAEHAERTLPPWRGSLYTDPVTLRAVRDLDDERSTTAQLVRHLKAGDTEGAQWHAARQLRVNGPLEERVALRFLEGKLQNLVERESGRRSRGSRSRVLLLLMRVMFERPPRSEEESEAWAGVRRISRSMLAESVTGVRDNHLMAASVLAGCAEPTDVELLLDWAIRFPLGSEEHRLGTFCVERVVRRLQLGGRAGELAFDRLWPKIDTGLDALLSAWPWEGGGERTTPPPNAFLAVAVAFGYAERMESGRTALHDRLPLLQQGLIGNGKLCRSGVFALVGAAGSEALAEELMELSMSGDLETPWRSGRAIGASGVPGTPEALRERWTRCGDATELRERLGDAFEAGVTIGRERSEGIAGEEVPDADSLLGAAPEQLPAVELICVDKGPLPEGGAVVASWNFHGEEETLSGLATGVHLRGAEHRGSELGGYAEVCYRFGASEVQLSWEIPLGGEQWR
jgi:serine/threonine protein kinase